MVNTSNTWEIALFLLVFSTGFCRQVEELLAPKVSQNISLWSGHPRQMLQAEPDSNWSMFSTSITVCDYRDCGWHCHYCHYVLTIKIQEMQILNMPSRDTIEVAP